VPVYFGAPNVTKYIPAACFIDFRRFDRDYDRLLEYLQAITAEQYQELLANIYRYLNSAAAQKFSIQYMIHSTLRVIIPEYKASIAFDKDTAEFLNMLDRV
jgi:hypothetical protein